jgi:hypothetical protein
MDQTLFVTLTIHDSSYLAWRYAQEIGKSVDEIDMELFLAWFKRQVPGSIADQMTRAFYPAPVQISARLGKDCTCDK